MRLTQLSNQVWDTARAIFKQIFSSDDNVGNQTIQTVRNQLQQLQTTQQYLQQVLNIYDALKRIPSEQLNATIDSLMQQVSAGTTPQLNPIEKLLQPPPPQYDREKYKEMILDAAETVLGFFGFDRTVYSNFKKGRRKKWFEEVREQRARDMETEMI